MHNLENIAVEANLYRDSFSYMGDAICTSSLKSHDLIVNLKIREFLQTQGKANTCTSFHYTAL